MGSFNLQLLVFLILTYSSTTFSVEIKSTNEVVTNIVKFYNKKTLDVARSVEAHTILNPPRSIELKKFLENEKMNLKLPLPKLTDAGNSITFNLASEQLTLKSVFPKEMQIHFKDQSVVIKNNMTSPQIKEKLSFLKNPSMAVVVALELFEVSSKITSSFDLKKKVVGMQTWCSSKNYKSLTGEDRQVLMDSIHLIYNLEGLCVKSSEHDFVQADACVNLIPKATACLAVLLNGPPH